MADLSRIQFEKEKEILTGLIKSFGKKKKREGKEKNKLVIELIQRITISDGGVSLIYPSTARLIESGRHYNINKKFFGLMKETSLAPTSEIKLLTTEELTQALCLDFSFELSRLYFNGAYDVRNFLSFGLLKNSPENDKLYCFLDNRKTRKLNYNGNPKASASKGKDAKTNKTLQDWLDAPAAWTLSEIKNARSIATTEEKLLVAEYLKNSNVRDRSTLKADYTGIRLMTDVFDPYELNTISNTTFYNRASTQKDIYANHHYAFMKVGKKVSMHYCDRKMLMKNRGVEERFAPLDPTARRNKNIKNFVIKHFNFLLYAITGKLRSTNLPNSCGFDALRNAHEYNGKVYPEFRILAYLNSLPNLRTKVTYFGMLASTMSGIIDALHFNIDVVDHDIDMILRTDAEKKLPGHIKNINQHYTYTLDDIEAEDYKEAYHHEGKTLSSDRSYGSTMSNAVRAMLQNFIFLCKLKVALLFSVTTTFCAAFLINKVMLAYSFTYMTIGLVVGITAVSIFVPLLLILLGLML